jgi:hypothetical protein
MKRKRNHIPLSELLASALADLLPQTTRDVLRWNRVSAREVIRLFTPDHNELHAIGGKDKWWNLTMRQRGPELKAKDIADTKIAAKIKRLRGETCTRPTKEIAKRANAWPPKGSRKLPSKGMERRA